MTFNATFVLMITHTHTHTGTELDHGWSVAVPRLKAGCVCIYMCVSVGWGETAA